MSHCPHIDVCVTDSMETILSFFFFAILLRPTYVHFRLSCLDEDTASAIPVFFFQWRQIVAVRGMCVCVCSTVRVCETRVLRDFSLAAHF